MAVTGASFGADGPWVLPANARMPDGLSSHVNVDNLDERSAALVVRDLGVKIPDKAAIRGVTVTVLRKATAVDLRDEEVRLTLNNVPTGANRARRGVGDSWPLAFASVSYGSPSDSWDLPLTPALVNTPGFGASVLVKYFGATEAEAFVDAIQVNVTYCD